MHPALRKGPLFLQKKPPHFLIFTKAPPISFPAYGPGCQHVHSLLTVSFRPSFLAAQRRAYAGQIDDFHAAVYISGPGKAVCPMCASVRTTGPLLANQTEATRIVIVARWPLEDNFNV